MQHGQEDFVAREAADTPEDVDGIEDQDAEEAPEQEALSVIAGSADDDTLFEAADLLWREQGDRDGLGR